MRTILVLCAAAAVAGGTAQGASAPTVPRDTDPYWAPQGTLIAFQRASPALDNGDVLYTPAVRGSEVDLVGPGLVRGFRPATGDLLVQTAAGTTSVRDASDRQIGSVPGIDATWSPDGTEVAFLEGDALAVAAASGADVRQLATGIVPPSADVTGPIWSPDGTSIAISTTSAAGSAIDVVPVDGSAAHVAFDGPGDNVDPSWSHDGSTLAFESDAGGRWSIQLVAPDGTGLRQAFAHGSNDRFPEWSPTDGRIAFLSDRSGSYSLYVGAPDGTPQQLVGSVAPDSPARWSPAGDRLAVSSAVDCKRFGIYVVGSSPPVRPVRRSNQCRIDGTPGPDFLTGTPYADVVSGYGGNDTIFAGNGDDVLNGGPGNDRLGAGPGNDTVYDGPGNDIVSGGPGNDVIYAGTGSDRIDCGPGTDTAYVGPHDVVRNCEHVIRSKR